jgi:hypothetical protein
MEAVKTLAKICSHMVNPPDTWAPTRRIRVGSGQNQTKWAKSSARPKAMNQAGIVPAGIVPAGRNEARSKGLKPIFFSGPGLLWFQRLEAGRSTGSVLGLDFHLDGKFRSA